jgi:hypothetical protein
MKEGTNEMNKRILSLTLLALAIQGLTAPGFIAFAQQEGSTPTQALVLFSSKTPETVTTTNVTVKVDNRTTNLLNLSRVPANGAQVAILIDDGLRTSIGGEMNNIRAFLNNLPQGTEVFVGYMQNGRVVSASDLESFSTDRAAIGKTLRLPMGLRGVSASPYFCLSDFVKNWPANAESQPQSQVRTHKARFVLMITNGVDPYNGSTNITNQDSPYVKAAVTDAQRAGVAVYSIYYTDAGFGRAHGSFSGQSYLNQVAEGTGGTSYYQGTGNPVSLAPFLKNFQSAISDTYVATFPVEGNKKMVALKLSTSLAKTKINAPNAVRPGTIVLAQ